MTGADGKSLSSLGFLTVVEHPQHGLLGGYLILNPAGRPLEFHCTAPVKPNRAQQILYGPTLQAYLYGEQIGQTLVSKAKVKASLLLTDTLPVLALREHTSIALALVTAESESPAKEIPSEPRLFSPADNPAACRLVKFEVGRHTLAVTAEFAADQRSLQSCLQAVAERLDLTEPFQRIRDAISEAQRAA